jgi:hypothetical protein
MDFAKIENPGNRLDVKKYNDLIDYLDTQVEFDMATFKQLNTDANKLRVINLLNRYGVFINIDDMKDTYDKLLNLINVPGGDERIQTVIIRKLIEFCANVKKNFDKFIKIYENIDMKFCEKLNELKKEYHNVVRKHNLDFQLKPNDGQTLYITFEKKIFESIKHKQNYIIDHASPDKIATICNMFNILKDVAKNIDESSYEKELYHVLLTARKYLGYQPDKNDAVSDKLINIYNKISEEQIKSVGLIQNSYLKNKLHEYLMKDMRIILNKAIIGIKKLYFIAGNYISQENKDNLFKFEREVLYMTQDELKKACNKMLELLGVYFVIVPNELKNVKYNTNVFRFVSWVARLVRQHNSIIIVYDKANSNDCHYIFKNICDINYEKLISDAFLKIPTSHLISENKQYVLGDTTIKNFIPRLKRVINSINSVGENELLELTESEKDNEGLEEPASEGLVEEPAPVASSAAASASNPAAASAASASPHSASPNPASDPAAASAAPPQAVIDFTTIMPAENGNYTIYKIMEKIKGYIIDIDVIGKNIRNIYNRARILNIQNKHYDYYIYYLLANNNIIITLPRYNYLPYEHTVFYKNIIDNIVEKFSEIDENIEKLGNYGQLVMFMYIYHYKLLKILKKEFASKIDFSNYFVIQINNADYSDVLTKFNIIHHMLDDYYNNEMFHDIFKTNKIDMKKHDSDFGTEIFKNMYNNTFNNGLFFKLLRVEHLLKKNNVIIVIHDASNMGGVNKHDNYMIKNENINSMNVPYKYEKYGDDNNPLIQKYKMGEHYLFVVYTTEDSTEVRTEILQDVIKQCTKPIIYYVNIKS